MWVRRVARVTVGYQAVMGAYSELFAGLSGEVGDEGLGESRWSEFFFFFFFNPFVAVFSTRMLPCLCMLMVPSHSLGQVRPPEAGPH